MLSAGCMSRHVSCADRFNERLVVTLDRRVEAAALM